MDQVLGFGQFLSTHLPVVVPIAVPVAGPTAHQIGSSRPLRLGRLRRYGPYVPSLEEYNNNNNNYTQPRQLDQA